MKWACSCEYIECWNEIESSVFRSNCKSVSMKTSPIRTEFQRKNGCHLNTCSLFSLFPSFLLFFFPVFSSEAHRTLAIQINSNEQFYAQRNDDLFVSVFRFFLWWQENAFIHCAMRFVSRKKNLYNWHFIRNAAERNGKKWKFAVDTVTNALIIMPNDI